MRKLLFIILILSAVIVFVGCQNETTTTPNQSTSVTTLREFTLAELAQYSGANGSTAYVAVNGIVYDVTDAFDNGMHQGIQLAGTDATAFFAVSPHTDDIFNSLVVVGTLNTTTVTTTTNTTTSTATTTTSTQATTTAPLLTTTEAVSTLPTFTLEELAQYTGTGGTTAYIAVSGVVYDVTNEFDNGMHQGMQLGGTDATVAFSVSPHSQSLLDTLTIVGYLE